MSDATTYNIIRVGLTVMVATTAAWFAGMQPFWTTINDPAYTGGNPYTITQLVAFTVLFVTLYILSHRTLETFIRRSEKLEKIETSEQ